MLACDPLRFVGVYPRLTVVSSVTHVMHDAQAPRISSGMTIFGKMLPCICMNMGHFECFRISRGPVCGLHGQQWLTTSRGVHVGAVPPTGAVLILPRHFQHVFWWKKLTK